MAMGLSDHVWSVLEYIPHPVHVSELTREIAAEECREMLTSQGRRIKMGAPERLGRFVVGAVLC